MLDLSLSRAKVHKFSLDKTQCDPFLGLSDEFEGTVSSSEVSKFLEEASV
jgi:hypothetical protein